MGREGRRPRNHLHGPQKEQGKVSHSEPWDPSTTFLPLLTFKDSGGKQRGKSFPSSCRPLCLLHSRRHARAADALLKRFIFPSGKDREYEDAGSSGIFVSLDAKCGISHHNNPVTPTLYYMQNITTKVLYSGILSPEEGLVCVFFQIQHYVLENVTSLYIVGSYSFSKATDTCCLPI